MGKVDLATSRAAGGNSEHTHPLDLISNQPVEQHFCLHPSLGASKYGHRHVLAVCQHCLPGYDTVYRTRIYRANPRPSELQVLARC